MSLSKIRYLKPSKLHSDGFHCSFTFEPLKCHVCELIPREAYTVNCCERNYCKDCISSLEENYSTCPGCDKVITYSFNKDYNKVLLQFEVFCTNTCGWKGPLEEHDRHLNIDPPDETWLNGCHKITVACIHCRKWNTFKHTRTFFRINQHLEKTFDKSKLNAVCIVTSEAESLWYEVGEALGHEKTKLEAIRGRYSRDSECYQQLLKEWIESGKGANWYKLLCALREPNVQSSNVSRKVERMIVCGVASELEVKQLKEEAESLLQYYNMDTRENIKKCYQSLNDEIQYLEWEENAKLLDKGYGGSQRGRHRREDINAGNENQVATGVMVGGAVAGTVTGVGAAAAAAATTAELVVGGMVFGPIGLAGGLMVGGIIAVLSLEQKRKRKTIVDKYTRLIDTCKEKIEELRPQVGM